jgi:hypothetical protein
LFHAGGAIANGLFRNRFVSAIRNSPRATRLYSILGLCQRCFVAATVPAKNNAKLPKMAATPLGMVCILASARLPGPEMATSNAAIGAT